MDSGVSRGKTWWRGVAALLGIVVLVTNGLGMASPRGAGAQSIP